MHVTFSVKLAATLHSPASGRYMDLSTNMPGLQFYSGNNLNGSVVGKGAYPYPVYGGLALETQVSCQNQNPAHSSLRGTRNTVHLEKSLAPMLFVTEDGEPCIAIRTYPAQAHQGGSPKYYRVTAMTLGA